MAQADTEVGGKMGVAASLIAIGAIMRFAVSVTSTGFNIHTIGLIPMIIGIVGLVLSLVFFGTWGGFTRAAGRSTTVTRTDRDVI
jgi:uncharacterized membrane protein